MRFKINWGFPVYTLSLAIFILNFAFAYYFIFYFHLLLFLFFIPNFLLDIIFYPVWKTIFIILFKKTRYELIISQKGIELDQKLYEWSRIKSISFQTGRLTSNFDFFRGFKLPALQKIYLLDKKGEEYSAVIDIDYFLKGNRERNNLVEAKKELFDMGKLGLLSDWAEKR